MSKNHPRSHHNGSSTNRSINLTISISSRIGECHIIGRERGLIHRRRRPGCAGTVHCNRIGIRYR